MAKPSVGEFVRQVRQEVSKVTWPSRKETVQSVIMVFLLSLFFLGVDQVLSFLVKLVLGLSA